MNSKSFQELCDVAIPVMIKKGFSLKQQEYGTACSGCALTAVYLYSNKMEPVDIPEKYETRNMKFVVLAWANALIGHVNVTEFMNGFDSQMEFPYSTHDWFNVGFATQKKWINK